MATNWDKDKPQGSTKIRLSDEMIRANQAALEDALSRSLVFPGNEGVDAGNLKDSIVETANIKDANVTLAKMAADAIDIPSGEIILFEKDTAVAGYTLQTDKDDMIIYITKGSAAGGQAGAEDKTGGTWTQPTHTHGVGSYKGPSHTHAGPSHTHSGPSHTHSGPSHTHSISSHTHELSVTTGMTVDTAKPVGISNSDGKLYAGSNVGTDKQVDSKTVTAGGTEETDAGGTGQTGASGTGQTGASGTGDTSTSGDAAITGTSGTGATVNTWRMPGRTFTRQKRN